MRNLAGVADCDATVVGELALAGIPHVALPNGPSGEVPTLWHGRLNVPGLGTFVFKRAWYYWRVSGRVPLPIAERLYANPLGRVEVRAGGDCACRPPELWANGAFVEQYDIDSQAGLCLFVQELVAAPGAGGDQT